MSEVPPGSGLSPTADVDRARPDAPPPETPPKEPEVTPRRTSLLFHLLIATGIAVGFAFWVYEIVDKPPVRLEEERVGREGLVSTVQALARNHSSEHAYCVVVEMTALSRGGFDIEVVRAEPTRGEGRIAPGQTVNFIGVFDGLTEEDYRERLDEFQAFVTESERC